MMVSEILNTEYENCEGTQLYRRVIVLEVLSNEPTSGYNLEDIARHVKHGDFSGMFETVVDQEISKRDMKEALESHDSDPAFLLDEKDEWLYQLQPGDEVTWNDPDDGACTRTFIIKTIEWVDDDVARITDTEGNFLECQAGELS